MPRVLVIDDDPTIADLLGLILRLEGYEVSHSADGAAGLLAALHERPDVVLLDLHLPSLSGYEVVRQIRRERDIRAVPVVAVTAMVTTNALEAAWRAGVDAILTKPFEPEDVLDHVRAFTGQSLGIPV